MSSVHPSASAGFAAHADVYAHGRPDYPAALDLWLRDDLHLGPNTRVVDLGAGTGKFTTRLLATGSTVLALEPVPAMLAQLLERHPTVEAYSASAEEIPFESASFDAVLCAQAFHWFANAKALAEIHRILRPGGSLGLVWNVRDERVAWVAALTGILEPYEAGTPRFHTGQWRSLFPAPGFTPLRQRTFPHGHTGSPEQVILARTLSISFIAALPSEEQEHVAAKVRQLVAESPDLAGKSTVTFPYITQVFACTRL